MIRPSTGANAAISIIAALTSLRFGCFLGVVAAAATLRHLRQRDRQGTVQAPSAVLEGAGADRVLWAVRGRPGPKPRHDSAACATGSLTAAQLSAQRSCPPSWSKICCRTPSSRRPVSGGSCSPPTRSAWAGAPGPPSWNCRRLRLLLSTDVLLWALRALFEPLCRRESLYVPNPISGADARHCAISAAATVALLPPDHRLALLALVPSWRSSPLAVPYLGRPTTSDRPTITQSQPSVNADQLPAYPTGFASKEMWTKNLASGRDVVARAARPHRSHLKMEYRARPRDARTGGAISKDNSRRSHPQSRQPLHGVEIPKSRSSRP